MKLTKIEQLPINLSYADIETAVRAFIKDCRITSAGVNVDGLFNQIAQAIGASVIAKNPNIFFWLAQDDKGAIAAWALSHLSIDVDNSLCYWMTDAWVARPYRHSPYVKQWLNTLRQHGIDLKCKHILIPSSRNTKAYLRFLGRSWKTFVTVLKEDI